MLSHHLLHLFFPIIYFTYCQSTIRIGIIDDSANSKEFVNLNVPNITFCGRKNLNLELYWINTSNSLSNLLNKLEFEQNFTNIYLTRTTKFSTQLIRDFCEMNHIPFINMKSYGSTTTICSLSTFVIFWILY
jgi:hypothetical protein